MAGPFSTREAALSWLQEHRLEHLQQVSASVLAPNLERFRLLDLASDEGVAKQTYSPLQLAPLHLPQRAWEFFQAEAEASQQARAEVEARLEAPSRPRAAELHGRLVTLRHTFGDRVPVRPARELELGRLKPLPQLGGFDYADPRRWEVPGHFGFIDPVSAVRFEPSRAVVTCSCQAARCLHALAAIDAVLRWLQQADDDALLEALSRPPWDRALTALADALVQPLPQAELTWRLEVEDDFTLGVTAYVGGKARSPERLPQPLPAADAALAAHCAARDFAAALAAMVGHPRIVLASNPNRTVTVTRTEVGLVAEDRNGPVMLTLGVDGTALPEPLLDRVRKGQHERPLFLWDPGTCRLEHLDLSPRVRAAFEVLTAHGHLFPPEAQPRLLEQLAAVAAHVPVAMPRSVLGESISAETKLVVRLELQPSRAVRVEVRVRPLPESDAYLPAQGGRDVHVRRQGRALHAVRRFADELTAARALEARLPMLSGGERVDDFVTELAGADVALELAHACTQLDVAFQWLGEPVRVLGHASARQLKVSVDRRPEREWFGVLGELDVNGERVKLAVALDAARRRRRYVRVDDFTYLELSDVLRAELERLAAHVQSSKHGLTLGISATAAVTALAQAGAHLEVDDAFAALTDRIERAGDEAVRVPRGLKASLRDYQREGFEWLVRLARWGAGGVLADDMGLGKTVQALALLLHRARLGPQLVLAPTSLQFNWVAEAKRFAPSLTLHTKRPAKLKAGDVLVYSYGVAVRDVERLKATRFATLVLDEAQALKNATTQRARAVRELEAQFAVALTGTPVENHLGELWSIYRIVLPSLFGGWDAFRDRFAIPIEKRIDPEAPVRLSRALGPFLLRRTKAQVATELPPRTEVRVPVVLSGEEWRLYEDARLAVLSDLETPTRVLKEQERRLEVLASFTRLRLLACHPKLYDPACAVPSTKLMRLIELIETLRAEGHRALVFSQFTSHLKLVREVLDARGLTYQYLDGATAPDDRALAVQAFTQGSDPLFLISLKAGGFGLNLTQADNVIHLDPWWNPAVEDQASDRAHRIGQTKPVTVYRLIAMGTIEEKMLGLHASKRALVAGVLDGKTSPTKLSARDLMGLLGDS